MNIELIIPWLITGAIIWASLALAKSDKVQTIVKRIDDKLENIGRGIRNGHS